MADNRGIAELPGDIFKGAMLNAGIPDTQINSVMGTLSNTCGHFHRLFQADLKTRADRTLRMIWQAVIDDHRQDVINLAHAHPRLFLQALMQDAAQGFVIQSKYTHQQFDLAGENILSVAVKRKQIEMVKVIHSCFSNFEQTRLLKERIAGALSQWSLYDTNATCENYMVLDLPHFYTDYAQTLFDVFKTEKFPNGVKGSLSQPTEDALLLLSHILLPKNPLKLDDYIDPELLLLALIWTFPKRGTVDHDYEQLHAFYIRTFGLVQTALAPESAKIICEGIANYAIKRIISERSNSLKMQDDRLFYRLVKESRSGLGFDYLCTGKGHAYDSFTSYSEILSMRESFSQWVDVLAFKQSQARGLIKNIELAKSSPRL